MNEKSTNRPYQELSQLDARRRPLLSDGWEYPLPVSHDLYRGKPFPLPAGPGTFPLDFIVYDTIKTIEVRYEFKTGREAEIQADEEGAPRYKIIEPEGDVIIPVGDVRQWVIHLPAGTSVHTYIDKWQWDLDKIARLPKWDMTPEEVEDGRRILEEARKRREQG